MKRTGLFVGITTVDIQYFINEFPVSNMKIKTRPPKMYAGGPATNASVAFAYLKGDALLASAVGMNPLSQFIANDLDTCNIKHFDFVENKPFNPVVASVITSENNGDRNIFTNHPPDLKLSYPDFCFFDKIIPDVLMLDGFFPEIAITYAKQAKKLNIPVVLDGGSWKTQYHDIIPFVDYAICSADFFPPGCSNTNDVIRYLLDAGIENIAVSRGEGSIIWSVGEGEQYIEVPKIKPIDTLGAGDFLHGAFSFFITEHNNFPEALKAASKIASISCRYQGTRNWLNS